MEFPALPKIVTFSPDLNSASIARMFALLKGWFGEKATQFGMWMGLDAEVYCRVHDLVLPRPGWHHPNRPRSRVGLRNLRRRDEKHVIGGLKTREIGRCGTPMWNTIRFVQNLQKNSLLLSFAPHSTY
jgi:hypothetical protein